MHWPCPMILLLVASISLGLAAEGISFHASFDRWLIADRSAGGRVPIKQLGGSLAEGKFGRALALDGSSYLEFPAGPNLPEGPLTVCLWFRPDDWGAKQYDNILGFSDTELNALHLERSDPGGQLRIVVGGPDTPAERPTRSMFSTGPLTNGEWVHIAVVLDAENQLAELFLNGASEARLEGPGPFPVNPPSLLVGCGFGRLGRAISGLIDDLLILDHAASVEEIKTVMEGVSGGDEVSASNDALAAVVDPTRGEVTLGTIHDGGEQLIIGPGKPWARIGDQTVVWQQFDPAQDAPARAPRLGPGRHVVWTARDADSGLTLKYHVQMQSDLPLACVWVEIVNDSGVPVRITQVGILRTGDQGGVAISGPGEDNRIFLDTGGLMGSGSHTLNAPDATHSAHGACVIAKPERGWAASVSFVTFQTARVTTSLRTSAEGFPAAFEAVCDYSNGALVQPGDALESEVLAVGVYGDGHEALARWADTVMAVSDLSPPRHCPSGWNSWYAYRLEISEDILLENARIIAQRFAPLGATTVQIDHGWQYKDIVGNWIANDRFPQGLPWLSGRLAEMGLDLGLWTAVSHVSEHAPLAIERPDTLFKDAEGNPFVAWDRWYWAPHGRTFTLDPTHPDGEKQYREMGAMLRSYGCKYVKNDFQGNLFAGNAIPNDASMTRGVPVYRKAMAAFREGMGPDMAYHACNGPLNVLAGLCDSAWVHGDLGNPGARWDWLRQWAKDFMCRAHVSGKFYWSDPDYLQVGQGAMDETRVRMAFAVLAGGPTFISDRLPELPEERLELIPQCLPSYQRTAKPVDLFERDEYPRVWDLPVETAWDQWHVVGLFNLDERPARIDLSTASLGMKARKTYLVFDYFAAKLLGEVTCGDGMELVMRFPLPATDVRVLRVARKRAHPFVLSTDMHLTQGGVELPTVEWDEATLTLRGVATRAPGMTGSIILYVPEGYSSAPGPGDLQGRLLTVPLEFATSNCEWAVAFEQE